MAFIILLLQYGLNVRKPDFFVDGPLGPQPSTASGSSRASVLPTGTVAASIGGTVAGPSGPVAAGIARGGPQAGSKTGLAHFSSSATGTDSADGYGL